MKDLSTGVQSFETIITEGYIYVDKTSLIYPLVKKGGYYFLSRPRRFGKTLLLRTIRDIFQGKKDLFKGLDIYSQRYAWKEHPIIYLNFAQIPRENPQEFKEALARALKEIATTYDVILEIPTLSEGLANLVKALSQKAKVVVLIDEYDKPIIDNLQNIEVAESNRNILKVFFEMLKGLDELLKLVFITGVGKFSQVSLFSGLNNVLDLTMDPIYATLLGYTEEEVRVFFKEHIEKLIVQSNQAGIAMTENNLIEKMREWYNGYRFCQQEITVYNPYSVMSFLSSGNLENYWFRTGTPTFFVEQMQRNPIKFLKSTKAVIQKEQLCDIHILQQINPAALMWQTGYLTIQKYDPIKSLYSLDFPNKEVREAFFISLLDEYALLNSAEAKNQGEDCKEELKQTELASFFKRVNSFFAKVPYHLSKGAKESFYHALFILLLESMGVKVQAEEPTNVGRIDLKIEMPNKIYIFELKMDKQVEKASQQIEEKRYMEKHLGMSQEIIAVGVSFSSTTRGIASWEASIYNSEGIKLKHLAEKNTKLIVSQ